MLASSRTPRRRKHTGWAAASGGGISGRGNPSDRAWRRGHLPLTREANCGAGLATNRETMISMLLRTRVGADSISARSAAPRTPPGGYGIRPYNGFFNVAANRETMILALPRTCVGDDACIVPHPTAAQTHRVGGRFRGRHFGAGQSLRPRLAARPPPFDKGGKLRDGACGQPGNRDLDVIANPCRGRFYIGPVCDAANARGRIWNPPLHGFSTVSGRPGLRVFFRNSSAPGNGLPVWLPPRRVFRG